MHTYIIAAYAANRVIGNKGDLIWHLPADQAFFFDRIKKSLLLTGRTSFESGHGSQTFQDLSRVIILSRQENYSVGEAHVVSNLDDALALAKTLAYQELAILGGAKVYEKTIDWVDELVITEIHETFHGDTFFPPIDLEVWEEVHREDFSKDVVNPYDYSFVRYTKRAN